MGEGHPLRTDELEVKWSVYEGGEARAGWGANRAATTLAVLVRGRFRLEFPERVVWLEREGDFVRWLPGVPHFWQADGPTVLLTVRWPSLPGDSYAVASGSRGVGESGSNDDGA
jgi:quercetin dioxygenase-like cupin family protein